MPALIITLLRRWVLAAVAVPLAAGGARRLARSLEARRGGPTTVSRGLTKAAGRLKREEADAQADVERSGRGRSGRGE